jgi:hypothetical protein
MIAIFDKQHQSAVAVRFLFGSIGPKRQIFRKETKKNNVINDFK